MLEIMLSIPTAVFLVRYVFCIECVTVVLSRAARPARVSLAPSAPHVRAAVGRVVWPNRPRPAQMAPHALLLRGYDRLGPAVVKRAIDSTPDGWSVTEEYIRAPSSFSR